MYLWVTATISSPVRQFSKSISLISSNMYNLLPWFCSPGKLSSLLLANQVICIFQGPLYRHTFTLEDLHHISFYCYHCSAEHTPWSTELWHSSQINKQKPGSPDSWGLGVSKELIFPTLDLVINLVLLLCLSLLSQMTVCPWIHQDMKICMFIWHFPSIFTYNFCLKCSTMEFHILLVYFIIPFFNLKLVYFKIKYFQKNKGMVCVCVYAWLED